MVWGTQPIGFNEIYLSTFQRWRRTELCCPLPAIYKIMPRPLSPDPTFPSAVRWQSDEQLGLRWFYSHQREEFLCIPLTFRSANQHSCPCRLQPPLHRMKGHYLFFTELHLLLLSQSVHSAISTPRKHGILPFLIIIPICKQSKAERGNVRRCVQDGGSVRGQDSEPRFLVPPEKMYSLIQGIQLRLG